MPRAPSVFLDVDRDTKSGADVPGDFNLSLGWCLPKGDGEGDVIEVIRETFDPRPLAGKHTDNKTIVLANVLALEPQHKLIVHKSPNRSVLPHFF